MQTGSSPRWMIAALVAALLILLAGGAWIYSSQEQALRQKAEADLQAIADLKVNQIVTWRGERMRDAVILADSPFFTGGVQAWSAAPQEPQQTELLTRLRALKAYNAYSNILLVDPTGQIQLSVNDQPAALHPDTQQALESAFETRQPVMTDLHLGSGALPPQLDIVAPLFTSSAPDAPPLAAVVLQVDAAQFLYPLIQSWPLPSASGETLIIRRDGDSVLFLNELRHQSDTALRLRIPLTEMDVPAVMAVMGQRGVVQGLDYRGIPVLAVIEDIPDSPWFIVAKIDAAEILADWNFRALFILVLVLSAAAIIAATFGVLWMREQKVHFQTLFEAERAHQESERKYRLLFENMTVGFALHEMIFDAEGRPSDYRFLEVNPAFEKLTGATAATLLGRTVREALPGTEQFWIDLYGRVVQTGESTTAQNFSREFDKYYDVWAFPAKPGQFGVVFTDITEYRRITQALQESEERFRRAVDDAPFPMIIHAEDGEIVIVNKVWTEITGYAPADIPTVPDWTERAYGARKALVEAEIDRLYTLQERVSEGEFVITTRSGETRTWDFSSSPLGRLPDGRRLVLSMAMDVTERKQAEVALRESEERYRFLFEHMQEGCQIISPDWRYLYLNAAVIEHGRQPKEALLGRTMMECYPGIETTRMFAVLKECMDSHTPQQIENLFEYPDGTAAWFELRIQPVPEGIFVLSLDITARKAAEAALRESEARYKSLFENNHAVMLLIDPASGNIVDANPAACAYYGWSHAELCAMRVDEINTFPPQEIAAAIQQAQQGKQPSFLFKHRLADGTIRDVEIYSGPIEVQGKQVLYSIVHDVTDRKQFEIALQESEERLRLFIEHAPASLAMFDREMRYLAVSRRWLADYHLGEIDLIGQSHYEVFPEVPERWKEIHRRGMAGAVVKTSEDEFVRANGSVQWLAWEVRPWYTVDEAIGGIVVFSEDITERRAAEEEVHTLNAELEQRVIERTAELSDLYNNAPCGYHSLNADGVFERINDTELAWLGYTREEVVGKLKATDLFTPRSVQTFKTNFPILKERGWLKDLELEFVRKDGSILPVLLSATAVHDQDGRFLTSRSTMIDHTERKRIEEALQQRTAELEASNKELEAFSYSVSHDLRAPLRAVDGFSRILIEDFQAELSSEANRYLGLIRENAQQMGKLIDHLLAFSRLGRQALKVQEISPADLARDAFEELRADREGREIDLTIEDLPVCLADPPLLRQVFANLLGNALKFTRQRAKAMIRVGSRHEEGGDVVYFVQDNGVGFDMQYANKLFGVFQRLHRADDYEGSGVGLATVQRIIHRHGGRIWAESEIDKGTTFYFTLGKDSLDEY